LVAPARGDGPSLSSRPAPAGRFGWDLHPSSPRRRARTPLEGWVDQGAGQFHPDRLHLDARPGEHASMDAGGRPDLTPRVDPPDTLGWLDPRDRQQAASVLAAALADDPGYTH